MDNYLNPYSIYLEEDGRKYYYIYLNPKYIGNFTSDLSSLNPIMDTKNISYDIVIIRDDMKIFGWKESSTNYNINKSYKEVKKRFSISINNQEINYKLKNSYKQVYTNSIFEMRKSIKISKDEDGFFECFMTDEIINDLDSTLINNPAYLKQSNKDIRYEENSFNKYYTFSKVSKQSPTSINYDKLGTELSKLNNTKALIGSTSKIGWNKIRDALLPKYNISTSIIQDDIHNLGKHKYYTVAGNKLVELIESTYYKGKRLVDMFNKGDKVLTLGDAPGTWSVVLRERGFNVHTMSLMVPDIKSGYDPLKFKAEALSHANSNPYIKVILDNDGDLTSEENHKKWYSEQGKQWKGIFIDAAVDDDHDQENSNMFLTRHSLRVAREGVLPKGMIIIKTFTITNSNLIELIVDTSRHYEKVLLSKPISSRFTNSELYLIFINKLQTPTNEKIDMKDLLYASTKYLIDTNRTIRSAIERIGYKRINDFNIDHI